MNDVNATIGLKQLQYVREVLHRHRENAAYYRDRFRNLDRLTLLDYRPDRQSSYWLFTIRVRDRQRFMAGMKEANITVSQVHARNDKLTTFSAFRCRLPGVDRFSAEQVAIPVGWWLNEEQRAYIGDTVVRLCK
jgi:dTDP-4-amino-4,6-dideoxygalactose transaminase